jgi:hypothetical protein
LSLFTIPKEYHRGKSGSIHCTAVIKNLVSSSTPLVGVTVKVPGVGGPLTMTITLEREEVGARPVEAQVRVNARVAPGVRVPALTTRVRLVTPLVKVEVMGVWAAVVRATEESLTDHTADPAPVARATEPTNTRGLLGFTTPTPAPAPATPVGVSMVTTGTSAAWVVMVTCLVSDRVPEKTVTVTILTASITFAGAVRRRLLVVPVEGA